MKALTLSFFILLTTTLFAQEYDPGLIVKTQKTGMLILGSWAFANLISSPILSARTSGSAKYFHQMNGYWNLVNLGLAGFSYYSLHNDPAVSGSAELLAQTIKMEKILLFNAGLDIGYMATGLFLRERSRNIEKRANQFLGFGNSLILQGGFLFLFDLGFYYFMNHHEQEILNFIQNTSLSFSNQGFHLIFKI